MTLKTLGSCSEKVFVDEQQTLNPFPVYSLPPAAWRDYEQQVLGTNIWVTHLCGAFMSLYVSLCVFVVVVSHTDVRIDESRWWWTNINRWKCSLVSAQHRFTVMSCCWRHVVLLLICTSDLTNQKPPYAATCLLTSPVLPVLPVLPVVSVVAVWPQSHTNTHINHQHDKLYMCCFTADHWRVNMKTKCSENNGNLNIYFFLIGKQLHLLMKIMWHDWKLQQLRLNGRHGEVVWQLLFDSEHQDICSYCFCNEVCRRFKPVVSSFSSCTDRTVWWFFRRLQLPAELSLTNQLCFTPSPPLSRDGEEARKE